MNELLKIADARCFKLGAGERWLLFPWGPFGRGYEVPPGAPASRARRHTRSFFLLELVAATLVMGALPIVGWRFQAGWPWLLWLAVIALRAGVFARLTSGMTAVSERLELRQFLAQDVREVVPGDTGHVRSMLIGSLLYGVLFLVTSELGFGFETVDEGSNGGALRLSVLGGVVATGMYPQVVLLAAASLWLAPTGLAHDVVIVGWLCVWAWALWLLREQKQQLAT